MNEKEKGDGDSTRTQSRGKNGQTKGDSIPKMDTVTFRKLAAGKSKLKMIMENGTISIKVNKSHVPALMDSGANPSCMNEAFYKVLKKQKYRMQTTPCYFKVYIADGSSVHIKKRVLLPFEISGVKVKQWVLVMPGLSKPVILGVDFMRKTKAKLEFAEELPINFMIAAPRNIVIPPLHEFETTVPIVAHECLNNTIGVLENLYMKTPVPYVVKRFLVRPTKEVNKIRICLFNASTKHHTIKRGQPMAIYAVKRPEDFVDTGVEWGKVVLGREDATPVKDKKSYTIGHEVRNHERSELIKLLTSYDNKVFYKKGQPLGVTPLYEHRIDWKKDAKPRVRKSYRMNPQMTKELVKILKEQESQEVIEKCTEEVENASPAFLVEKPRDLETGKMNYRMVIDYRETNANIKTQIRSFTAAAEALEKAAMGEHTYFSK